MIFVIQSLTLNQVGQLSCYGSSYALRPRQWTLLTVEAELNIIENSLKQNRPIKIAQCQPTPGVCSLKHA